MNLHALRHPQFRWYFAAAACSVHALWIQRVVIGWLAWSATGAPAFVGWVAALMLAPTIVAGPLFGVMVDRGDVVRGGALAYGGMMLCNAVLLAGWATGLAGPTFLSGIAVAIGLVAAGQHPVRMSLGPRLVPTGEVGSVVALAALNFNFARSVAPALGGLVIDRFGVGAALWLTVALMVPPVVIVTRLRPRAVPAPPQGEGFVQALRRGLGVVRGDALIGQALMLTGIFSFSGRAFLEILPVIADGIHGRGPAGLGVLASAAGVGAVAAAVVKATLPDRAGARIPPVAVAVALAGLSAVAALGLGAGWQTTLGLVAVAGFAGTYAGVSLQSAIQHGLADDLRGRVMSLWVVVGLGAGAAGAFALGWVAQAAGPGVALSGAGLLGIAGFAAVLGRGRR